MSSPKRRSCGCTRPFAPPWSAGYAFGAPPWGTSWTPSGSRAPIRPSLRCSGGRASPARCAGSSSRRRCSGAAAPTSALVVRSKAAKEGTMDVSHWPFPGATPYQDYHDMVVTKENGVVYARLNVPDRLNPLTPGVPIGLKRITEDVRWDDDAKVLVFTGTGGGLRSGADVSRAAAPGYKP